MSLHLPPESVSTELWTRLPDEFRSATASGARQWIAANKPGQAADSFLEGPAFDRDGNLFVTDIPYGRIFRISPHARWTLIAQYEGWPNGLKIHRHGRWSRGRGRHGRGS